VISTLSKVDRVPFNLVDETMFVVDAPRPVAGQAMLQRLRLSDALERRADDVSDQEIHSLEKLSVGFLPVEIILPGMLREDEIHSTSSRFSPPPDSSSATDSRRRLAFLGLRRRYAVSASA